MFAEKLENYKFDLVNVADLKPFPRNSRKHSDGQIQQVINSISEFGFTNPILIDENNIIIAGHCRLIAAKKLGMKNVPCVTLAGLTETQKKAYVIADNKLALNAEWDIDILLSEVKSLQDENFDIELTGFTLDEIADITPDCVNVGLTDDDAVPEAPAEPITKLGEIWTLGNHRLMCGDATMIDDVEKLMNGEKADLGFCDPPYNLGFNYKHYDDNKSYNEYDEFSRLWFSNLQLNSDRQIITLGTKNISIMASLGNVSGVACWVKKNWITSCHIAKLQQWEPIFFYGDFTKLKRISDLFEINRVYQKDVGSEHECPKQIELMVDILNHYSIKNVLDLFGGSGSTLIACEKTNRKCYMMEISPQYCDVIVKRWEQFTGNKAVLNA